MNCFDFYTKLFDAVFVTEQALELPSVKRGLDRLSGIPVYRVPGKEDIPRKRCNSRTLFVTTIRGDTVHHCPGSRGHLCCNYITVDLYEGCLLGCSYCIMKSYLNFFPLTVYADTAGPVERIREFGELNKDRIVRIGTGETGDSLLLDPVFELSAHFIEAAADYPHVYFELKTKTDFIDHLLHIPHKGSAVIGFSLNPDPVVEAEEGSAVSVARRFAAARKAAKNGFNVSFHFDPIIMVNGWQQLYSDVIEQIGSFPYKRIAWISLGTFRYPVNLKGTMGPRPYLYDEFVRCRDGKYRYLQPVRNRVYTFMKERLRSVCDAPLYLCMESPTVWQDVFGGHPLEVPKTAELFRQPRGVEFWD
jgi:spore photoproduct lyase